MAWRALHACLRPSPDPQWYQGLSWSAPQQRVLWRADEIELVTATPIKPGGVLIVDPGLPQAWWATLDRSLEALAAQPTTRVATPQAIPISQDRVTVSVSTTKHLAELVAATALDTDDSRITRYRSLLRATVLTTEAS